MSAPPKKKRATRYTVWLSEETAEKVDECSNRLGISAGAILRSALKAVKEKPSLLEREENNDLPGGKLLSLRLDPEMLDCVDAFPELGRPEVIRRTLVAATSHIQSNKYRVIWPLEL